MALKTDNELEQRTQTSEDRLSNQKGAENRLDEKDSFYSDLFYYSPNSIVIIDPDTSIREVNPAFEKTTGYSSHQLIGKKAPYPWWTENSIYESKKAFKTAICEGKELPVEDFYQKKNGEPLIVTLTHSPVSHHRKMIYSIMTLVDITQYKQWEASYKENEKRLNLVLKGANISWWDWDIKNDKVRMDERWLKIVDYKPNELKPGIRSLRKLVHPDDKHKVFWSKSDVPKWRRDSYVTEYRLKAKSGEWRWILVSGNVVESDENGNPLRATGIHADVSERKNAEQALRESEERLKAQYHGNPTPIFTWQYRDNDFFLMSYNKAAEKITNGHLKTHLGKAASEIYQNKQEILDDFQRCLDEKKVIQKDRPIPNFIPDKHVIVSYAFAPPDLIMVHAEDATEQVKAAEDKKKLEAQFWLAQKMESLGTLAGGVAHDFNNLLQTIQGNVSLMSFDIQENHPHYKSLKDIEGAIQSGAQLTRQLLGFAKGGVSHQKRININDIIEKTCDMFGRTKKEIDIQKECKRDIWPVEVDQGQIEQVFLNIYINAWQAMPDGGKLNLTTENVTIHESYSGFYQVQAGRYVKISIADTGVGMDKKTQERIFEPFFTTKEMGRGTGLGLASSYGIIRNHGGVINVYSEIGQGTTFNIYLPAGDKGDMDEEELPKDLYKGTETILLVDDEETVIDVGKKILKRLGYKVWIVRNGQEAVDFIKKNLDTDQMPDLVVLDMIMPGMGGGQVYDRIKAIKPDIKVLLSSGYSINGQATDILKRGCEGFIQKPFNVEEFSKKIQEILNKK